MACSRSEVVPVLSLVLKRLRKLLPFLLSSASCHVNEPKLACWRVRDYEGQSQDSSVLPPGVIQEQLDPSQDPDGRFVSKPSKEPAKLGAEKQKCPLSPNTCELNKCLLLSLIKFGGVSYATRTNRYSDTDMGKI